MSDIAIFVGAVVFGFAGGIYSRYTNVKVLPNYNDLDIAIIGK